MATDQPYPSEREVKRRFQEATDDADKSVAEAQKALATLGTAEDDDARRELLHDGLEALLGAAYSLGLAEGHLLHLGYTDPLRVPRFRQALENFADTWAGTGMARVANIGDRGRAAVAAGLTAAAGAILGAATLGGLPGAVVGSITGGAAGPYLFMRNMRGPEDLGDAVLGGGVGGIFTPAGAALGAYLAGDELAKQTRRKNPPNRRCRNGWVGDVDIVGEYLDSVHADRDQDGRFLIGGDPPVYGGGGEEIVISDRTVYYVEGRPVPLAPALESRGGGVPVKVFNPLKRRLMEM